MLYSVSVERNDRNVEELRKVFVEFGGAGENITDISRELTEGSGTASVYLHIKARENTEMLAVNLPDRERIIISIVGTTAPSYLPELQVRLRLMEPRPVSINPPTEPG